MHNLGYTNAAAMVLFEQELSLYEEAINPHSNNPNDYHHPADLIKNALLRIVTSPEADTYTLMRRLVARMQDKVDDEYSDFAIRMMAAATKDLRANQLIMSILYITRDILVGDRVDLNDRWLVLVDGNMAIYQFLKNYNHSDQKQLEDTYSGNIVSSPKVWQKVNLSDPQSVVTIGYANYEVKLTGDVMQTVSFVRDPSVQREADADPSEALMIVSEVVLTPTIGVVAVDKSVMFYDDAKAQLNAHGNRFIHGYDTQITLPGLFYSAALSVISTDGGNIWRVSEINILPPSIRR